MAVSKKPFSSYLSILKSLHIYSEISNDPEISYITEDSRNVVPGTLFIAIDGDRHDGRDYIEEAVANGAVAVVLKGNMPEAVNCSYCSVENDYTAFGLIAEHFHDYPAKAFKSIAVTGTNGKTTTAFLIRQLLESLGHKTALIGTVEYDLGERIIQASRTTPGPSQLQELFSEIRDNGVDYLIMEVSSHALSQRRMGSMKFAVAGFTNLSQDHLDYHQTMDAYFDSKMILFKDYLADGAHAVINGDDEWGRKILSAIDHKTLSYAIETNADLKPENVSIDMFGTDFDLNGLKWHSPLIGDYNLANLLLAVACLESLGINASSIRDVTTAIQTVPGRLQTVMNDRNLNIFVDYAHTDAALDNLLKNIKPLCQNKLITVFGCGGNRDRRKRPLMGTAAARWSDIVIVTSDNPRREDPHEIVQDILPGIPDTINPIVVVDRRDAIAHALMIADDNDTIIIAGKGHEDYQEINDQQFPFSDVTVTQELLLLDAAG